jgi:crotonobetainyl-CoA:carnitine CoA-transferase CaiB-like acyl-CoA transferase
MSIGALEQKFWDNFCRAQGRVEWTQAHFSKTEDSNSVYQELIALFKSKTFYEWIEFAQKVDCCMAPVLEIGELNNNPYFQEKELIFASSWGDYQVKMHSDLEVESTTPPPQKNEHKDEILKNILI